MKHTEIQTVFIGLGLPLAIFFGLYGNMNFAATGSIADLAMGLLSFMAASAIGTYLYLFLDKGHQLPR